MKTFSKVIAFIGMISMLFSLAGCKNPNGSNGGGEQPDTPIASIKFTNIKDGILPLTTGDKSNLNVKDSNGNTVRGADITWTSSDPEVATVETGKVTALKAGQTVIKAEYKTFEATVTVKVTDYVPTGIIISKEKADLYIGKELSLEITLDPGKKALPENAEVEWTSSNDEICSVTRDENNKSKAKIEGIKAGEATITVKYRDFEKTCVVKVTADPNAPKEWPITNVTTQGAGVSIYLDNTNLGLVPSFEDESEATSAVAVDANGDDITITQCFYQNETTLYVSTDGTHANMTLTISATINGVAYKSEIIIENGKWVDPNYVATGLVPSESEVFLAVDKSNTITITLTTNPNNMPLPEDANISWVSDDTSIATVTDGAITAVANGKTKVTATYKELSAEIIVNVVDAADLPKYSIAVENITGAGGYFVISWSDDAYAIATGNAAVVKDFTFGTCPKNGNDSAITKGENAVDIYMHTHGADWGNSGEKPFSLTITATSGVTYLIEGTLVVNGNTGKVTGITVTEVTE